MSTKCFFVKENGKYKVSLRRFSYTDFGSHPGEYGYHNSSIVIDELHHSISTSDPDISEYKVDRSDERWPSSCYCGYEFKEEDQWQINVDAIYESEDGSFRGTLKEPVPGMMYYADWYIEHRSDNWYKGPDGHSLIVILPNGNHWAVDGPCSNCTKPGDIEHKCWVRHGVVPNITVDKNGNTCSAGAGSVQSGNYHGFLRDGYLTDAC